MSESSLTPEQKELLRSLVEARNRFLPDREPFNYFLPSTGGSYVTLMHRGFQEDPPDVLLSDLTALEASGYILLKPYDSWGGEFALTGKAPPLYERIQQLGDGRVEAAEESEEPSSSERESPVEGHVFRKDGQKWTVTFEGTTAYLDDTKGMRTLWVLISHPGEDYTAVELDDAVEGITPPPRGTDAAIASQLLWEDGLSSQGLPHAGEAADGKAIEQVENRLEQLKVEIAEAEKRGDQESIFRLKSERKECRRYLNYAVAKGGRPRLARDKHANVRSRVHNRIIRALEVLEVHHPALHLHLHKSAIKTTPSFAYRPDRDIDWNC